MTQFIRVTNIPWANPHYSRGMNDYRIYPCDYDDCDHCRRKFECWTGKGINVDFKEIENFREDGLKSAVKRYLFS